MSQLSNFVMSVNYSENNGHSVVPVRTWVDVTGCCRLFNRQLCLEIYVTSATECSFCRLFVVSVVFRCVSIGGSGHRRRAYDQLQAHELPMQGKFEFRMPLRLRANMPDFYYSNALFRKRHLNAPARTCLPASHLACLQNLNTQHSTLNVHSWSKIACNSRSINAFQQTTIWVWFIGMVGVGEVSVGFRYR